jgi:hypothetical protein
MKSLASTWLVGLLMAGVAVGFQTSPLPLGARLKLRWDEKTITAYEGKQKHLIELGKDVNATLIGSAKLQSAKEKGGFIYLLLDVSGPSRGRPAQAMGHCGAGDESNLIWVKLGSDWQMEKAQSFLYESCLESLEVTDGPDWDGSTLEVRSTDYSKNIDQRATYSLKHPEAGLQIDSQPMTN